jgi:hypothetical protein
VRPVKEGFASPDRNAGDRDGVGKEPRHRSPSRGSAAKNCEGGLHEHAEDNRLDQHIDHRRVDLVGPFKALRTQNETLISRHAHANRHENCEDVLQQTDPGIAPEVT